MKIRDFLTEQWMNDYERLAKYNLTDTSCQSLDVNTLTAMEPDALNGLVLDYGWISGDPDLRQEVLSLYANQDPDTLTFSHGALHGCELAMEILLEKGDHVITFTPGYQQYEDLPKWLGCDVTCVPFRETDWSVDFEALEKAIRPETKLVVFANPSNPTGTFLNRKDMECLIEICRRHNIWILCDEVYHLPDPENPSVSDLYEKGIASGSLSKKFGLAGLRLGWVKGNADLIHEINVFKDYSYISCGPLKEKLAWIALKHKDEILKNSQAIISANKQVIAEWLKDNPDFECVLPEHGSVCFLKVNKPVDVEAFARDLLKDTGIFFVPGTCFNKDGYLRLGLGRKHEDLAGTLEMLNQYLRDYPVTAV